MSSRLVDTHAPMNHHQGHHARAHRGLLSRAVEPATRKRELRVMVRCLPLLMKRFSSYYS